MKRNRGFTLLELLVVIAIIAILAALIFPVYARAKENAYRNSDITNMNEIRTAMFLYRADNGGFPPQILGYATIYMSGPNMGQIVPANSFKGYLYNKRVDSIETLRPALNRVSNSVVGTAEWPNADARAAGAAPLLDLNGDGVIDVLDDPGNARQANSVGTLVTGPATPNNPCAGGGTSVNKCFYKVSGYDVAEVPTGGTPRNELRYTLFWSTWGLSGGNALDDPRQLGYEDPPDNTVVTWNSFYRQYEADRFTPQRIRRDIVLFLGGAAKPYDSRRVYDQSWRILP